jgi:hypothetical protein
MLTCYKYCTSTVLVRTSLRYLRRFRRDAAVVDYSIHRWASQYCTLLYTVFFQRLNGYKDCCDKPSIEILCELNNTATVLYLYTA